GDAAAAAQTASEYEQTADAGLFVRFPAKAGTRLVTVAFIENPVHPEVPQVSSNVEGDPTVDNVQIAGPFNGETPKDTPSRRRIFVCNPSDRQDEEACARKILTSLAHRAYRRPVTEADVQMLLGLFKTGRSKAGFDAGIRW